MNMVKLIVGLAALLALAGCSNMGSYYAAIDGTNARSVEAIRAQAEADAARYAAIASIAASGDETARVAATMALALSGQGLRAPQMAVPQAPQNEALQWASVLVPGLTQGMSIYYGAQQAMRTSDNATRLGLSTNATFARFAHEINSPIVVTQPDPVVVTAPDPVIVTAPDPVIVNPVIVHPKEE